MSRTALRTVLTLAALHVTTLAATAQKLWVVDAAAGPGHHYTDFPAIAPPIQQGDGLIVKSGTYTNDLVIDGYELTVFARKGATATLTGDVTVRNVPPGVAVLLEGLDSAAGSTATHEVSDNDGHVWIEECRFEGQGSGLTITGSANVVLTRCSFLGDSGLAVDSSHVTIWTTTAEARDQAAVGAPGGDGLAIGPLGDVFAVDCAFAGGDGGDGDAACTPVGAGGNGATISTGAFYEYWDSTHTAGQGGSYVAPCTGPPDDGTDKAGAFVERPYPQLRVEDSGAATYSTSVTLQVLGAPGTLFELAVDAQPAYKLATPPGGGRIVLNMLGQGPGGVVGQPSDTIQYTQHPIGNIQIAVAFLQPGYYHVDPGPPAVEYLTGGPTAVIFHRANIDGVPTSQ